uniref:Variant surface glycoprotein 1415 n=1 Tax=Trypanosoma brucei TaxID=5691 RepID=M4SYG0_9TRYP|nr:variant surface glycoprotein 1415 [Trypanosoma brucei]
MKPGDIAKSAVALAISMAAVLQLSVSQASAAGPTKGLNRKEFGILCTAVVSSENIKDLPQAGKNTKEAAAVAAHISLILSDYLAIQKLATTPPKQQSKQPPDTDIPEKCRGSAWAECIAAAAYLKSLPSAGQTALKKAATDSTQLRLNLNITLAKLLAAKAKLLDERSIAAKKLKIATALKKAVYGGEGTDQQPKLLGEGSERQAHCGTKTTGGTSAKLSIGVTIACLCASGSNSDDSNTACYRSATTNQADWNQNTAITAWDAITTNCENDAPQKTTATAQELRHLTNKLKALLYEPKGNDGTIGYIGNPDGSASAGNCDGDHTGGKGGCATFTSTANTITLPPWLTELENGARAAEEYESAAQATAAAEATIEALNETLATTLYLTTLSAAVAEGTVKSPEKNGGHK